MPYVLGFITALIVLILLCIIAFPTHFGRILLIVAAAACHIFNLSDFAGKIYSSIRDDMPFILKSFVLPYIGCVVEIAVWALPIIGIIYAVIELVVIGHDLDSPIIGKLFVLVSTLFVCVCLIFIAKFVGIPPALFLLGKAIKNLCRGND